MARYIDVDLLIQNIASIEDLRTLSTKTIGEVIDKTPTADVVEMKHGKWEKKKDNIFYWYECSECCKPVPYNQYHHLHFGDYCPNCGAKMDGGKKE